MRLSQLPSAEQRAVRAAMRGSRRDRARGPSPLEAAFDWQLRADTLQSGMHREYRFHPERGWRFDFAWPARKVAVEIDGAIWRGARGGHTSGTGRMRDMEKGNAATLLGWRVLELAPVHVHDGRGLAWLRALLET